MPLLGGDLLGAVLVDDVVVAGRQRIGVLEGDLVLARVALALGRFDLQSGAVHAEPDLAQDRLDPAGAEDRVVDVVLVGRGEVGVALRPRRLEALVEEDELELGADHRDPAALGEAVELRAQHLPRRLHDRSAVEPLRIGEQHGRGRLPRDPPQRGEVRRHQQVAVAALPGRHRVTRDGVHLDIDGEQVIAAFGAVLDDLVQEVVGVEALAGQPALDVDDREDDGVDGPARHVGTQRVESQWSVGHGGSWRLKVC